MTRREWIDRAEKRLLGAGVEDARLDAELLVEHVLDRPRMNLLAMPHEVIDADAVEALERLLVRRESREPLQHIVGSTSFWGLPIKVAPSVLIPRPETESLAEMGWRFLGAKTGEIRSLDWGTGSGCIAIAIAAKCPAVRMTAIDRSADALATARRNARLNKVEERIDFRLSDGFSAIDRDECFDLIISNPPYIPSNDIPGLQIEVREHDPMLALDGGADGLDCYRAIAAEARAFLRDGGLLMVEFGDGQEHELPKIFEQEGWRIDRIEKDLSGRFRFLIAGLNPS